MMMMSFGALGLISVLWVLYGYSLAFGNDVGGGLLGNLDFVGLKGLLAADPARRRRGRGGRHPAAGVRRLPGRLRDHHRRADLAARSPTAPSSAPGWCSPASGRRSSTSRSRTGSSPSTATPAEVGRLDRQRPQGDRLRRRHRGAHQRRCRGPGARARARQADRLRQGADAPAQPDRWSCSAPACCGSAGSASTPARRSAPATPPRSPGSTPWSPPRPPSLAWLLTEQIRDGHATSLGAASGVVAGLVAITPACSAVTPVGAILVGAVAGVLCALAVGLKFRFGYDDSLDVVGVHLVGGLVGTLLIGFLATDKAPGRRRRPVLRRWRRPALAAGRRGAVAVLVVLVRARATSSARSSTRRSASGSTRRTRSPAST